MPITPAPELSRSRTPQRILGRAGQIWPGAALCLAIAGASTVIGRVVPILGAAVPAIIIGVIITVIRRPAARLRPGIAYSSKFLLQLAVVLLGAQLSLASIFRVGLDSLPVMFSTLTVCLAGAWAIGRFLHVEGKLRTMIGVGTGICGASAIAAVAPVIGAASADIAYAISTIFLFNILAVVIFPLLGHLLGMSAHTFGLFAGTAVNDTSSVVAAASVFSVAALSYAVVVKLVRTLMIIPITITLAIRETLHDSGGRRLTWRSLGRLVPWFLVGFLLVAIVNSFGIVGPHVQGVLVQASIFLIATALAGIGLSTDIAGLRRAGWRPLALGALLWILVACTSLAVLALTGAL